MPQSRQRAHTKYGAAMQIPEVGLWVDIQGYQHRWLPHKHNELDSRLWKVKFYWAFLVSEKSWDFVQILCKVFINHRKLSAR